MKEAIRDIFMQLGADVCGFAGIERFSDAPKGFHPCDVYADCRTAIVFGVALPTGLFEVNPRIVYHRFNVLIKDRVDLIAFDAASALESDFGGTAVPFPCDSPYEYWDAENTTGKGLVSMRHAAVAAGLGQLGKSTLLLNEMYGTRLAVGLVLTSLVLESDPIAKSICIEGCRKCLDSCPTGALDGTQANQKLCRPNTYMTNARGFEVTNCNTCRAVCPRRNGAKNR